MKIYVYSFKLQWIFSPFAIKEVNNLIKGIGARSLTKICLRDSDMRILYTYTDMVRYPEAEAQKKAIAYIRKQVKLNENISFIELVRV